MTLNANISANTELSLEYTWTANQDFSRDDPWVFQISTTKNTNLNGAIHLKTKFEFVNAASASHEPPAYGSLQTQQTGALGRYLHWQGAHRAAMQTLRKIRITFFVDVSLSSGTNSIAIQPIRGSQWPNGPSCVLEVAGTMRGGKSIYSTANDVSLDSGFDRDGQ